MLRDARLAASAALLVVLAACGGGQPPGATQAPGTTASVGASATAGTQPTGGPVAGEPLGSEGVSAALTALQALDSWTFEVKTWTKSLGKTIEQTISGTQRNEA